MGSITVSGLGKAYKHYPARWARLREWMALGRRQRHELKWVLQDINFTVRPGEALGIIGINGAGKSTLLKLITGTILPTTGRISTTGRVSALLELGIGFHPDFTGRQNATMAGQLLGLNSEELERLMPEIESFAEIGDHIDQPVRVYSSGMQMRLAFSVATVVRPDILIIDEALSVGDVQFQHKCFDRIRAFREEGTTLLIVSHDKQAILSFCDRALLLSGGTLAMEGQPEAVIDYYNALLADGQPQKITQEVRDDGLVQTTSGTGEATVIDIGLYDDLDRLVEVIEVGQPARLRISVLVHSQIDRLVLGFGIKDRLGQVVFGTNTDLTRQALTDVPRGTRLVFDIAFPANLGPGSYSVQTALCSTETHLVHSYEWRDLALVFRVVNANKARFDGMAWLDAHIRISHA